MRVLHISAECYPVAKVGGLADVVGALPKYQSKKGNDIDVVMPFYDNPYTKKSHFEGVHSAVFNLGDVEFTFEVLKLNGHSNLGYNLFMVKIPGLLDRENVYSYGDDTERFTAFQIVVLDWIIQLQQKPEIIHCHDHHTGLIPFMMSHCYKYDSLKKTPSILTIHNAQYQGWFDYKKLYYIPGFDISQAGLLDWNEQINPLAAAIKCAWKVTTVSPGYMEELKQKANGLESLLDHESPKESGILNGIDPDFWNTGKDNMIIKNYSVKTHVTGKAANKEWLCNKYNLDIEKPLFIFIGRLVWEKGADLLPDIFYHSLINDDIKLNILVLGSGSSDVESRLRDLIPPFRGSYNVHLGYDEKLSHIMYAGADFLLMPSRIEPCGLNQMYALKYGTVPVVRRTGGLKDTVIDIGDNGFGICHKQASVGDVCHAIARGVNLYEDQSELKKIKDKIMQIDHSWDNSAKQYNQLYESLIN